MAGADNHGSEKGQNGDLLSGPFGTLHGAVVAIVNDRGNHQLLWSLTVVQGLQLGTPVAALVANQRGFNPYKRKKT